MKAKRLWLSLAALWLLAQLLAAQDSPAPAAAAPADNVVILLDASGSMSEPMPNSRQMKMAAAKAALQQVLRQLPASVHVGLLVFSGKNVPDDWVYPLGPRDDARLTRAIESPQPGGGTPLGAYLKKAADRLLKARAEQFGYGTFRLLVVTDGEAQDQNLVTQYTPEIIGRGITLDVIGVAMNRQHTLATRVHSYRAANDAAALKRAVAEVFAEVGRDARDTTGAEALRDLEGLPNEVAMAAIQALATAANHPVGTKPAAPAAATAAPPEPRPAPAPAPAAAAPAAATPPAQVPAPSTPSPPRGAFGGLVGFLVCFCLPLVIFVKVLRRALKRTAR